MRRGTLIITMTSAALLIGLAAGCGSSDNSAGDRAAATDEQRMATGDAAATAGGAGDQAAATVTLTGTLGCGHCNYHVGHTCSAALKTADGTIYVIDGPAAGHELFDSRFEQKQIKVVGTITQGEDAPHITLTSYEMM